MDSLRVLVVSSKYMPEYAGSALRAHRTYQRLAKKYPIEFEVLCSSVTENSNASYLFEGVPVRRVACKMLPQESLQSWDQISLMHKVALRFNYISEGVVTFQHLKRQLATFDLVHVFGNVAVTSMVISLCNLQKKPLIVEITYHSSPLQYKPQFMRWIDREVTGFHTQTQFVCISRQLEQMCRKWGIKHKIWTRPNPVDIQKFHVEHDKRGFYRKRHCPFDDSDYVLVNIAKFMPLKNQIFLLDVLKELPEQFKLVLAGPIVKDGPNFDRDRNYVQTIQEKIRILGLVDRVYLYEDFVQDVEEFIKMADVYVFPSQVEGLGTPMIESLCCGIPVVAHRIEGVTDAWIREGVHGFTCELEPKIFAQRVQSAVDLDSTVLEREAIVVKNVASQEAIDQRYYEIMQELIAEGVKCSA